MDSVAESDYVMKEQKIIERYYADLRELVEYDDIVLMAKVRYGDLEVNRKWGTNLRVYVTSNEST